MSELSPTHLPLLGIDVGVGVGVVEATGMDVDTGINDVVLTNACIINHQPQVQL